jgi:predicted acylesterase/phospholipase RssA
MPLHIVASNITKGIPSVFSKDVPLLKAILASCCLPGVFKPQDIYGQLYIDGDMFTPCIANVIGDRKDALILVLGKYPVAYITPKNIDNISPILYSQTIFSMIMNQFSAVQQSPDILYLRYPELRSTSDIKEFDIKDIVKSSAEQLSTFLTKRGNQESTEGSR